MGDGLHERTALKVNPKFLRIALRYIPQGYDSNLADLQANPPVTHSMFPPKTPMEVIVFRMTRLSYLTFSADDIQSAANAKWRVPGLWKQDVETDNIQDAVKALHFITKCKMSSLYSSTVIKIDDSGPNGAPRGRGINTPLASYKQIQFKLPNKQMLFRNLDDQGQPDNLDANWRYLMLCRVSDVRVPTGYYNLADPYAIDVRKCFVYEDA